MAILAVAVTATIGLTGIGVTIVTAKWQERRAAVRHEETTAQAQIAQILPINQARTENWQHYTLHYDEAGLPVPPKTKQKVNRARAAQRESTVLFSSGDVAGAESKLLESQDLFEQARVDETRRIEKLTRLRSLGRPPPLRAPKPPSRSREDSEPAVIDWPVLLGPPPSPHVPPVPKFVPHDMPPEVAPPIDSGVEAQPVEGAEGGMTDVQLVELPVETLDTQATTEEQTPQPVDPPPVDDTAIEPVTRE